MFHFFQQTSLIFQLFFSIFLFSPLVFVFVCFVFLTIFDLLLSRHGQQLVRETTEIEHHPNNINRKQEDGFLLKWSWKPLVCSLKERKVLSKKKTVTFFLGGTPVPMCLKKKGVVSHFPSVGAVWRTTFSHSSPSPPVTNNNILTLERAIFSQYYITLLWQ